VPTCSSIPREYSLLWISFFNSSMQLNNAYLGCSHLFHGYPTNQTHLKFLCNKNHTYTRSHSLLNGCLCILRQCNTVVVEVHLVGMLPAAGGRQAGPWSMLRLCMLRCRHGGSSRAWRRCVACQLGWAVSAICLDTHLLDGS
jgi:hypothetical protein